MLIFFHSYVSFQIHIFQLDKLGFIPRFVCHLSINNSICDHTLFLNTSVQPDKSIILHYFKDNLITVLNVGISTI